MHPITIDDYIPCIPNGGPFFSTTLASDNLASPNQDASQSIWLHILEKAFAKLHGGYKYLEGGCAVEALRDLTGAPMTRFEF